MVQCVRWLALMGIVMTSPLAKAETRAVTLNLHGHHPMGAQPRYFEYRDGRIEKAPPDLFYFRLHEVTSGEARRQAKLAEILQEIDPDFVAMQEVVAGRPGGPLDCDTFHKVTDADVFGGNVALRLIQNEKLNGNYRAALVCRGNVGWVTGTDIFRDRRIVKVDQSQSGQASKTQVIWDFHEAPYPSGMVVEGFAIVHKVSWNSVRNERRVLQVGARRDGFVFQLAAFQNNDGRRVIIANLHAGHKVRHFEQAVAVRNDVELFRRELSWPASVPLLIMGDFNEPFTLPNGETNLLTLPWSLKRHPHFDWSVSGEPRFPGASDLKDSLEVLSRNNDYKPWANVPDASERIQYSISRLEEILHGPSEDCLSRSAGCAVQDYSQIALQEIFESCGAGCQAEEAGASQDVPGRIDFIFAPEQIPVLGFGLLGRDSWDTLDFVSDHPLIWARLAL